MEHYITKVYVEHVRHLKDIEIDLGEEKRTHLILTGKNGSGKTSLLRAIKQNLSSINNGEWNKLSEDYRQLVKMFREESNNLNLNETKRMEAERNAKRWQDKIDNARDGLVLEFSKEDDLDARYQKGQFVTSFFAADRMTRIDEPHGVEDVKLQSTYTVEQDPVRDLMKYLVHLKTQQAYAQNERDTVVEKKIEKWLDGFEAAIRSLMDDETISLEYDYRNYKFEIRQEGREPYDFKHLSDGYSAAIRIVADLLMRMDQNWLMNDTEPALDTEGVVLIDEIETHLHLELQRTILPFLTKMFPRLQFIVTTHSPFVVSSLDNAVIYDLENHILARDGLTNVSYSGVVEGFFRADELSEIMRKKFERYKALIAKENLSDEEYAEIMDLEVYLDEIPDYLSIGIATEYSRLKLEFENRENKR